VYLLSKKNDLKLVVKFYVQRPDKYGSLALRRGELVDLWHGFINGLLISFGLSYPQVDSLQSLRVSIAKGI
jgi:hypothetical protein